MRGRAPLHTAAAGILVAILAASVLAVDQLSKYLAIENLPLREAVPVWGEFLQWYLVYNPGAAFSLGEEYTWIFTIALGAVAVAIPVVIVRSVRSRVWAVTLGLLLGGVLGNLFDRLFREPGFGVGHGVDFILTPWMWFWMNPAIYNVADMFIVTMMVVVAVLILRGVRFDGTREDRETAAESDEQVKD